MLSVFSVFPSVPCEPVAAVGWPLFSAVDSVSAAGETGWFFAGSGVVVGSEVTVKHLPEAKN